MCIEIYVNTLKLLKKPIKDFKQDVLFLSKNMSGGEYVQSGKAERIYIITEGLKKIVLTLRQV